MYGLRYWFGWLWVRLEACKLLVSAGFRLDAGMRLGYRPQAWILFEASAGFRFSVLVLFWFETGYGFSLSLDR